MRNKIEIRLPYTKNSIFIICEDKNLLDILNSIYMPYAYDQISRDNRDVYELEIDVAKSKLKISKESDCSIYILNKDNIVGQISRFVQGLLHPLYPWNFYHGASIKYKEKTFVFLGESGGGKTTLTAYLVSRSDFEYVAEDILIIDYDNNNILPFTRPLHLREDSIKILEKEYGLDMTGINLLTIGKYNRFIKDVNNKVSELQKIDYYILLKRTENDLECKIEEVTVDKLDKFLENCFLYRNIKDNVISCTELSSKYKLYELKYKNLEQVQRLLKVL